jgi:hypothetical protein
MQDGQVATDPAVLATQERLSVCTYAMAHPETGQLVPACVQHSVLDPGENEQLRQLLPLTVGKPRGRDQAKIPVMSEPPLGSVEQSRSSGFDPRLR